MLHFPWLSLQDWNDLDATTAAAIVCTKSATQRNTWIQTKFLSDKPKLNIIHLKLPLLAELEILIPVEELHVSCRSSPLLIIQPSLFQPF